jgi:hypothetical protein
MPHACLASRELCRVALRVRLQLPDQELATGEVLR